MRGNGARLTCCRDARRSTNPVPDRRHCSKLGAALPKRASLPPRNSNRNRGIAAPSNSLFLACKSAQRRQKNQHGYRELLDPTREVYRQLRLSWGRRKVTCRLFTKFTPAKAKNTCQSLFGSNLFSARGMLLSMILGPTNFLREGEAILPISNTPVNFKTSESDLKNS
jgi:hypothetical protein